MAGKLCAVLVAVVMAFMGRPLTQASLADGLVAYWSLDEGNGSTADEASRTAPTFIFPCFWRIGVE